MSLFVYSSTYGTRTNGPGTRNILHLSGCACRCLGCFSPHTWDRNAGKATSIEAVANCLLTHNPEGITISGGEPLEQSDELLKLLVLLYEANLPKGIILYSGMTDEQRDQVVLWPAIVSYLDGAVLGPYDRDKAVFPAVDLCSSSNQHLALYGKKLTYSMFTGLPTLEVLANGTELKLLGFPRKEDVCITNS